MIWLFSCPILNEHMETRLPQNSLHSVFARKLQFAKSLWSYSKGPCFAPLTSVLNRVRSCTSCLEALRCSLTLEGLSTAPGPSGCDSIWTVPSNTELPYLSPTTKCEAWRLQFLRMKHENFEPCAGEIFDRSIAQVLSLISIVVHRTNHTSRTARLKREIFPSTKASGATRAKSHLIKLGRCLYQLDCAAAGNFFEDWIAPHVVDWYACFPAVCMWECAHGEHLALILVSARMSCKKWHLEGMASRPVDNFIGGIPTRCEEVVLMRTLLTRKSKSGHSVAR